MRFQVGQKAGDYEFLAVVESSATGVTYRVRNLLAEREELLKVLPPDLQDDQERVERFLREAKIHARLQHPNVAAFYNATRLDGQLVMTSEVVEGASLEQRLSSGSLTVEQAGKYFEQALSALSYAHRVGVVHRDLKPAHLIITRDDNVKITGFGLAKKPTDPQLTQPGIVMGSVHYMSPEQVKGAEIDRRSDIYSLGVVLYEAVTGKKPFDSKSQFEVFLAHVNQDPERPSSLRAGLPEALDQIILTAMAKQPASRFQTAEEFRDSLSKLHGVLGAPAAPAIAPALPQRPDPAPEAQATHSEVAAQEPAMASAPQSASEPPRVAEPPRAVEPQPEGPKSPWTAQAWSHEAPDTAPPGERPSSVAASPAGPPAGPAPTAWSEPKPPEGFSGEAVELDRGAKETVQRERDSAGPQQFPAPGSSAGPEQDWGATASGAWDSPASAQTRWEEPPAEPSSGRQSDWDYEETEAPAPSGAAERGWAPAQRDFPSGAAAGDSWPEDEPPKDVPLLLRPTGDTGAHRYTPAVHTPSRQDEARGASWFGEQAFAGWTSKDLLAVGALTFVIVAAVFFALLTFLNR